MIFPKRFINKHLFSNLYMIVITRVFNYGIDSNEIALVPMADSLNHNCVDTSNEFINLQLHLNGDQNSGYYRVSKFMTDYSTIYRSSGLSDYEIDSNLNIIGRFDRKTYEINQQAFAIENISKDLADNTSKQIW